MNGFRIELKDGERDGNCMVVPSGRLDCDAGLKMEDELMGLLNAIQ